MALLDDDLLRNDTLRMMAATKSPRRPGRIHGRFPATVIRRAGRMPAAWYRRQVADYQDPPRLPRDRRGSTGQPKTEHRAGMREAQDRPPGSPPPARSNAARRGQMAGRSEGSARWTERGDLRPMRHAPTSSLAAFALRHRASCAAAPLAPPPSDAARPACLPSTARQTLPGTRRCPPDTPPGKRPPATSSP